MKTFVLGIVALVIAGMLALHTQAAPTGSAAAAKTAGQKWEYATLAADIASDGSSTTIQVISYHQFGVGETAKLIPATHKGDSVWGNQLATLGLQGWEMVSYSDSGFSATFKRPLR